MLLVKRRAGKEYAHLVGGLHGPSAQIGGAADVVFSHGSHLALNLVLEPHVVLVADGNEVGCRSHARRLEVEVEAEVLLVHEHMDVGMALFILS